MFPPTVPLIGHKGIPPLLEAMSSQYPHQLHQGLWELSLLRAWCWEYGGPAYSYWGGTCLNDDNECISNKQCIGTYWGSGRSRRCLCMLHSWQWLDSGETYWRSEWTMQGNWTLRRTSHFFQGPQALNCRYFNSSPLWIISAIIKTNPCWHSARKRPVSSNTPFWC